MTEVTTMHGFKAWCAAGMVGAVAALAGCGGTGGSSSALSGSGSTSGASTGKTSVLLKDAPLVAVNGRTFSELDVDITGFSASVPGTRTFTAISFTQVVTVTSVNLLDLSNSQEFLAFAALPAGDYDAFRITIDPTTAHLVEQGTNAVQALTVANPQGNLTFVMHPPLHVDPAQTNILLIDWRADRSVTYDAQSGDYILDGFFVAQAVGQGTPVSFRQLPGMLASVDTTSGDMRLQVGPRNQAEYLVRTNLNATNVTPAALLDDQGNTLQITDFAAGDFVVVEGSVDANADIDATLVRKLTQQGNQLPCNNGNGGGRGQYCGGFGGGPSNGNGMGFGGGGGGGHNGNGGGHNGGGNGGNGGPGNGGPGGGGNGGNGGNGGGQQQGLGIVFAHGVVHNLDTTAQTFELDTSYFGTVDVTYDASNTEFGDARQGSIQATTASALADGEEVDVLGIYVAPAAAGGAATIDATHTNGPGPTGGPGGVLIVQ